MAAHATASSADEAAFRPSWHRRASISRSAASANSICDSGTRNRSCCVSGLPSILTEELGFEIPIYFVTLDPERDTPQQLADYLPYFGNRIIGITGNTDAILSLAKSWGIYRKKISTSSGYTIDHTATVFMLSDSGKFQGTIAWGENDQIVKQKLERLWYK